MAFRDIAKARTFADERKKADEAFQKKLAEIERNRKEMQRKRELIEREMKVKERYGEKLENQRKRADNAATDLQTQQNILQMRLKEENKELQRRLKESNKKAYFRISELERQLGDMQNELGSEAETYDKLEEDLDICSKKYEDVFAKFTAEAQDAENTIQMLTQIIDDTKKVNASISREKQEMEQVNAAQIAGLEKKLTFYQNEVELNEEELRMVGDLRESVANLRENKRRQQERIESLRVQAQEKEVQYKKEYDAILAKHKADLRKLTADRDYQKLQAKVNKEIPSSEVLDQPQEYYDLINVMAQF
jgi:chromosome segregation ATPase